MSDEQLLIEFSKSALTVTMAAVAGEPCPGSPSDYARRIVNGSLNVAELMLDEFKKRLADRQKKAEEKLKSARYFLYIGPVGTVTRFIGEEGVTYASGRESSVAVPSLQWHEQRQVELTEEQAVKVLGGPLWNARKVRYFYDGNRKGVVTRFVGAEGTMYGCDGSFAQTPFGVQWYEAHETGITEAEAVEIVGGRPWCANGK